MSKSICISAILALASTGALAQNASSKATAAINTAVYCTLTTTANTSGLAAPTTCTDIYSGATVATYSDDFIPIMSTSIKVSNSQSLFVTPSLVTGLYTNTTTKTKSGGSSTAVASGGVYMRAVLRNPNTGDVVAIAYPLVNCTDVTLGCVTGTSGGSGSYWGVILDSRVQTLTQALSNCVADVGGVTGTCSFDLTTQLILQTTSAHTFGFIFPNVGVGTYNVSIEAAVDSNATLSGTGVAVGSAAFGLGSVTVESVRLVHSFSF